MKLTDIVAMLIPRLEPGQQPSTAQADLVLRGLQALVAADLGDVTFSREGDEFVVCLRGIEHRGESVAHVLTDLLNEQLHAVAEALDKGRAED